MATVFILGTGRSWEPGRPGAERPESGGEGSQAPGAEPDGQGSGRPKSTRPAPTAPVRRLVSFEFFLLGNRVVLNREARSERNGLQN